jgi:hypothetical protein
VLRNKSFAVGLGTGLIAGAILLQVMISVSQAEYKQVMPAEDPAMAEHQMATEEMKNKMIELGYQVYEADIILYTQEQVDALVEEAKSGMKKPQAANEADLAPIKLTIQPGSSSSDVAELLYRSGLIADKKQFENELAGRRLASKIQAGSYEFAQKPQLDELIQKITKS